tara:strand:+ start:890 stop:1474 length:585 start_codon:yes stop_codon:yes gene_type:complete
MNAKNLIRSKYFYISFLTFIIFLFSIIDFKKNTPSTTKNTSLTALTLVRFIDSKFENLIPYIEPAAMDHYSYTPSRINYIRSKVKDLYGYDVIDHKIYYKLDQCTFNNRQRGKINYCVAKNYWLSLSNKEWIKLLDNYDIEILIAPFKINNLYLCNSFEIQENDPIIGLKPKDTIYYYKKSKDAFCQKLIQKKF